MAVTASLKELKRVNNKLKSLKMKYPEAYKDFQKFFKENRSVGYKNICKMLMGETTPEELKDIK